MTGRGGTAKVKTFSCYCCTVTTATRVAAQPKEKCFQTIASSLNVFIIK